jgi:beta-phosphoglucomutase
MQSDKTKRALIFDFDGVIVSTEKLHFDSYNAAFDELLGIRIGGSYKQLVGLTLTEIYALWCNAVPGPPLHLTEAQGERLLARKTELFFELGEGQLHPIEGVVSLAQRARSMGWYITVSSRSRRIRMLRTMEMAGLLAIFDLVMGCEDGVEPRTDRKHHSRTVAPFGISPANCVVIEDSASGVRDALDCGIGHVIGLTTSLDHATLRAAGAHATVDTLNQVVLEPDHRPQGTHRSRWDSGPAEAYV